MGKQVRAWWLDRVREPSTYQGLSLLAGVIGGWLFDDPQRGIQALEIGVAIAGVISLGKTEAVAGRDY